MPAGIHLDGIGDNRIATRAILEDAADQVRSPVLNAYNVVVAALLVPAGRLADRIGRRRVFFGGVAIFLLGSTLAGAAPSDGFLIGARAAGPSTSPGSSAARSPCSATATRTARSTSTTRSAATSGCCATCSTRSVTTG